MKNQNTLSNTQTVMDTVFNMISIDCNDHINILSHGTALDTITNETVYYMQDFDSHAAVTMEQVVIALENNDEAVVIDGLYTFFKNNLKINA